MGHISNQESTPSATAPPCMGAHEEEGGCLPAPCHCPALQLPPSSWSDQTSLLDPRSNAHLVWMRGAHEDEGGCLPAPFLFAQAALRAVQVQAAVQVQVQAVAVQVQALRAQVQAVPTCTGPT